MQKFAATLASTLHVFGAWAAEKREQGQTTIEYAGILVFVGAAVAILIKAAPAIGAALTTGVVASVAKAFASVL